MYKIQLLVTTLLLLAQLRAQNIDKITLGLSEIELVQFSGDSLQHVLFLNVHEDEQTSIKAIQQVRENSNLNFSYIKHQETRNIQFKLKNHSIEFDPNRIYTFKGRRETLKRFGKFTFRANKEIKKLDLAIKALVKKHKIIVTLHNNTDVNYTIKSYSPGGEEASNTKEIFITDNWDPDDFIYTTNKTFFDFYKSQDINVILQDNNHGVNDGSLSIFCGKQGIPYINIEAQKGHLNEQVKLIEATLTLLNKFNM